MWKTMFECLHGGPLHQTGDQATCQADLAASDPVLAECCAKTPSRQATNTVSTPTPTPSTMPPPWPPAYGEESSISPSSSCSLMATPVAYRRQSTSADSTTTPGSGISSLGTTPRFTSPLATISVELLATPEWMKHGSISSPGSLHTPEAIYLMSPPKTVSLRRYSDLSTEDNETSRDEHSWEDADLEDVTDVYPNTRASKRSFSETGFRMTGGAFSTPATATKRSCPNRVTQDDSEALTSPPITVSLRKAQDSLDSLPEIPLEYPVSKVPPCQPARTFSLEDFPPVFSQGENAIHLTETYAQFFGDPEGHNSRAQLNLEQLGARLPDITQEKLRLMCDLLVSRNLLKPSFVGGQVFYRAV